MTGSLGKEHPSQPKRTRHSRIRTQRGFCTAATEAHHTTAHMRVP
jgi:hypothetical protein